jgi:hypothetical protein
MSFIFSLEKRETFVHEFQSFPTSSSGFALAEEYLLFLFNGCLSGKVLSQNREKEGENDEVNYLRVCLPSERTFSEI